MIVRIACALVLAALVAVPHGAHAGKVLLREDFNDLAAWREVFFPKIPAHSTYTIENRDGGSVLAARSASSASLLVYRKPFDIYSHPDIRWRWKVSNVYRKADPRIKSGDDYPVRVYIAFEYDPRNASPFDRVIFNIVRLIYGEYPPLASLNYVWASTAVSERSIPSPYTDRNRMIFLEKGPAKVGQWVDEEVNVLKDYEEVFGKKPPRRATIGIMSDSDNTGEKAEAYLDFIEVYRSDKTAP